MELDRVVLKVECGNKSGTAFLISGNRAITAFHVITEFNSKSIFLTSSDGKVIKANLSKKIDDSYKKLDVALLELESEFTLASSISIVDYNIITRGTKWCSRGYPKAKEITGDNTLKGSDNIINQQLGSLRNSKIDLELEHSKKLSTYAGYSGSPVVIYGNIVGIINNELLECGESKELTALSIKYFKELLVSEGVHVESRKTSKHNPLRKVLSEKWFNQNVEKSISDLGVRYTPEINVKLKISNELNAILRNQEFYEDLKLELHKYLLKINNLEQFLSVYKSCGEGLNTNKWREKIFENMSKIQVDIERFISIKIEYLDVVRVLDYEEEISRTINDISRSKICNKKTNINSIIIDAENVSYAFRTYINNRFLKLANHPYMLLQGRAGTGKSHLLADTASKQNKLGIPAILLLGQHFTNDKPPWSQVIDDLLRLKCSEEELLKTLNEIGEEKEQQVLFIIDAINEGRGKYFWSKSLNSFVNDFKKYPWISLVISIRDTYARKIIPKDFADKTKIIYSTHVGFSGCEHEAVKVFFNNYNIELPKIPFINPEFSNPLFLKLFCEGLFYRKLSHIPKGYGGITSVINYFLDNIDDKLCQPEFYDYGDSRKVCRKIVNSLIRYKAENELNYIPYDDACDLANEVVDRYSNKRGIIEDLVHEGLFSKNIYWLSNEEDEEGIYFSYERLDDHFSAALLIDEVITKENIIDVFKSNGKLNYLVKEEYKYQGLLESLSLQLPERYGLEFFELLDEDKKEELFVINSLVNSLLWRNSDTISTVTDEYVKDAVLKYVETFESFIELSYSIAGDDNHSYNANTLHNYLISMTLPERDALWSVYLKNMTTSESSIGRLLEWIKESDMHKSISYESKSLIANAILWLCTTTDIELRNSSTIALATLLIDELKIGHELLKKFENVDDPYVYERLLAALYGATLNSTDFSDISMLSQYIVDEIFLKDEVYPNVLVRDYARNIVEFSLFNNLISLDDSDVIRPPYNSKLPEFYPSNDETDKFAIDWNDPNFKEEYWSKNRILSSMVTEYGRGTCRYGDFGRYTFQAALNLWKDLDPNPLSNYACKLIFEKYGYDVELHGKYDRNVSGGNRFENKVERIGKKYQWLALYEVVARLGDNIKVFDDRYDEGKYYQGPWQNWLRNIDPTHIISKLESTEPPIKLNSINYNDWEADDVEWLISDVNLPDPILMIEHNDFLSLQNDYSWKEKNKLGLDSYRSEPKNLWYQVRSYLVREENFDSLREWLKQQNFMGRWMPEGNENYSVFSKEHYWSPAYKDKVIENDELDWQAIKKNQTNYEDDEIIAEVLPTAEVHRWEGTEATSFLAARDLMFKGMNFSFSEIASCWFNENGILACFDPHMFGEDSSQLLVNKELLEEFLKEEGLKIIWTVLGEKQIQSSNLKSNQWLEISGVYELIDGHIKGEINKFIKVVGA